ncbi:MAG: prohibitin family protein [Fibrobacterota bacterium]|nr:prohibitin family protein [Fibrobacterota bacterium]
MTRHPEMDGFNFNGAKWIPGVVAAVLIIIFVTSCYHIVPPGHRGISVTLGKVNPQAKGEGLAFKLPFIQKIYDFPVRSKTVEGNAASYSSDLQTVQVTFKTLYRIPENQVITIFQQYSGDPYTTLVEPRIQEELKQTTSLYRAEELVKSREKIKIEVLEKVKKAVGDLVLVTDMAITNFDFTEELERAIEQKTIREQEALAKSFELDKARKDAEITIVNAEAEARSVKIKGEALRNSPDVISLEIVKKWNGVSPTSVVTGRGGADILLPVK